MQRSRQSKLAILLVAFGLGCTGRLLIEAGRIGVFKASDTEAGTFDPAKARSEIRLRNTPSREASESRAIAKVPEAQNTPATEKPSIGSEATIRETNRPNPISARREALYSLYETYSASREYWKFYGPLPAIPLGVDPTEFLDWRGGRADDGWFTEDYDVAIPRISNVNRATPNELSAKKPAGSSFQLFAYDDGSSLQSVVGSAGLDGIGFVPESLARVLASDLGANYKELPEDVAQQFQHLAETWYLREEGLRRDLYRAVRGRIDEKIVAQQEEKDVALAYVGIPALLTIVRDGDDPELDHILRERIQRRDAIHSHVVEILSR